MKSHYIFVVVLVLIDDNNTHRVTNLVTAGGRSFAVNGSTIWELQTARHVYHSFTYFLVQHKQLCKSFTSLLT